MLRSKKDVDRHVRDILNKIKNDEERKIRGYNIARLYYNVAEYESARRYLSEFLTVRPKAMDAHKLLGQIFENLNNKEKAVQAYKTSYELGEGQKDLVLKICELYTDVQCDSSVRLYWAEEGHRLYPHHESIVKLREALLTNSGQSREELEKLYIDEIRANPTVVRLQTSLLQLYMEWGKEENSKLKDAYNYGTQVESRKAFPDSLEWYQTLNNIMIAYKAIADVSKDIEFHTNYLSALERLVYLTIASSNGTALVSQCTLSDSASLLHKFDQSMQTSLEVVGKNGILGQLMIGQLYLHMAIFLMQSTKKDSFATGNSNAAALLFHACRFRPYDKHGKTTRDQHFYKLACHRLSQAAHTLNHMASTETEKIKFVNKVKQQCSNKEAQESIYNSLYGSSQSNEKASSFFINDQDFINATLAFPDCDAIRSWDNVVGVMQCSSLRDLVWLCLQELPNTIHEPQAYYNFGIFEGLQFSSQIVNTGAPETLCHLDLLAFLAATVYCQMAQASEIQGPLPASMPTVIAPALNTVEQSEWWTATYTLYTNRATHRINKLRLTLQRGLEVIRANGNHGLDLALLANLAMSFTKWSEKAKEDGSTASEVDALEDRAEHYWVRVLSLCQKASRNIATVTPRNRLFAPPSIELSEEQRVKIEEEGKFFRAMRLIGSGKTQEAIQALADLKSPEASFHRANLYKKQSEDLLGGSNFESVSPEVRSQYTILLTQARDTLYLTLDRLRMPGVDRFHSLNTKLNQELEEVEKRLNNNAIDLDPSQIQRDDDTASLSDSSQSPPMNITNGHGVSASGLIQQPKSFSTPMSGRTSTRIIRQEARPSPERLDVQVRALTEVQENTMKHMDEQNQALKAQNEALRNMCSTISQEFKDHGNLYRSMLEQNKNLSQEAYHSILNEVKQLHATMKDMQTQMEAMVLDISAIKISQSSKNTIGSDILPDVKASEATEVVRPVDMSSAGVVPAGMYSPYMYGYSQQASPLISNAGLFGTTQPPFFPPSTIGDQTYGNLSTHSGSQGITGAGQSFNTVVATPGLGSPITMHRDLSCTFPPAASPVSTSMGHQNLIPASNAATWSSIGTSLAASSQSSAKAATTISPSKAKLSGGLDGGPHPFQISMPSVPASITPPLANTADTHSIAVTPTVSVKNVVAEDDDGRYVEDDHDPCPDFQPVIPLPDKVEVKTGEEDEQVLFEERAKLFRWSDKEWKERGTGTMKLLHNPSQSSVRVLMRRDQTFKICANHLINIDMDLKPQKGSDKVWIWPAQDFTDEELTTETFCCRFKTPEIASSFKTAFEKGKDIVKKAQSAPKKDSSIESTKTPDTKQPSLAEMFKKPVGTWECQMCLLSNGPEKLKCASCDTPNPAAPASATDNTTAAPVVSAATSPFGGFKFGIQPAANTSSSAAPADSSTGSAFSLSGLTFSGTPKTTFPVAGESKPEKAEDKKPSIFAGFSFGAKSDSDQTGGFSFSVPKVDNVGEKSSNTPTVSFTLPSSTTVSLASKDDKAVEPKTLFPGSAVGSSTFSPALVSSSPAPAVGSSSPSKEDEVEEYEPQVDFTPVIPLPELVEVKTGEEDEEVLFCERSKLFRYDTETKEWKERGLGELKILKSATNKVRVLMRREQIHKICANHSITPEISLSPMASSDKAWVWAAMDFADEEMKQEKFAARFKTAELAKKFHDTFEKAKEIAKSSSKEASVEKDAKESTPDSTDGNKSSSKAAAPLSSLSQFKASAGSWECDGCLCRNGPEVNVCPACKTNKPGYEPPKDTETKSTFSFGIPSQPASSSTKSTTSGVAPLSSLDKFKAAAGSWECDGCLCRNGPEINVCPACQTNKPGYEPPKEEAASSFSFGVPSQASSAAPSGGGFTFGVKTDSKPTSTFAFGSSNTSSSSSFSFGVAQTSSSDKPSSAGFSFGTPTQPDNKDKLSSTGGFSFGLPATKTTTENINKPFSFTWSPATGSGPAPVSGNTTPKKEQGGDGFTFGSPGKYEFSFSGVSAVKSPRSRDASLCESVKSEDGVVEDDGDHLYFEPVVPLPDKVEVVTGEENETILYCHRSKLFRLASGEWKERGIGDIRLLEGKENGKIRLLMRREQVHKICLNHNLNVEMEFRKKDEKTYYWATMDYSDNEPSNETFAIRFKTTEIAEGFFGAVELAKKKLRGEVESALSDTIVISETTKPATPKVKSSVKSPEPDSTTPAKVDASAVTKKLFASDQPTSNFNFSNVSGSFTFKQTEESEATKSDSTFGKVTSTTAATPNISFSFGDKISSDTTDSESIEVVYEKKASAEQVERARKLQLPDNFFLYEDAPACPGCPGCNDDLPEIKPSITTTTSGTSVAEPAATPVFGAKPSIFGGSAAASPSIFGGTTSGGSIFGGATQQSPSTAGSTPSIFGGLSNKPGGSPSIFGGLTTSATSSPSLFGGLSSSSTSSPSLFGGLKPASSATASTTATPVLGGFGKSDTTSSQASTPAAGVFGGLAAKSSTPTVFGGAGPLFGGRPATPQQTSSSTASTGDTQDSQPTIGTTSGGLFSNVGSDTSQMSFADLAKVNTSAEPVGFGQSTNKAAASVWAQAGAPIFSRASPKKTGAGGDDDDDDGEEDEHDPHFEPVVPLPELVEVKTGEEDMEVIYSQRCKTYRYDGGTKQWKERGVGDLKILYDPTILKYRLLQRREQVHKVSLNHYLTTQLDLRPMATSETAWCWYSPDYAEGTDSTDTTMQQLAVRFKNIELAQEFKRKFEECQERLRSNPPPSSGVDDSYEEDDDDDNDEDVENMPIFRSSCSLEKKENNIWVPMGKGDLKIEYDDDIYGARVSHIDENSGEVLANHIIAIQTTMHKEGNSATWTVLDLVPQPPVTTTYKATFAVHEELELFAAAFREGKEYAEKAGIVEQTSGEATADELYYGQD